jgi:hypothetical protein
MCFTFVLLLLQCIPSTGLVGRGLRLNGCRHGMTCWNHGKPATLLLLLLLLLLQFL